MLVKVRKTKRGHQRETVGTAETMVTKVEKRVLRVERSKLREARKKKKVK